MYCLCLNVSALEWALRDIYDVSEGPPTLHKAALTHPNVEGTRYELMVRNYGVEDVQVIELRQRGPETASVAFVTPPVFRIHLQAGPSFTPDLEAIRDLIC